MDEETSKDALLIGAGVALASAATVFYRRKQTRAFKIAYFLTWPTLGSAVLVACMPDHDEMAEKLEKSRLLDDDRLREQQRLAALQMSTLKSVASGGDAAASAKGKQL